MQKLKGFTIIEVVIVLVIIIVLGLIVFSVINAANGNGNYCDMYRHASLQDVPASCVDYFMNGEGKQ